MITIPMTITADTVTIPMQVGADGQNISMSMGAKYAVAVPSIYDGSYEITPSADAQTLHTADKMLSGDIIINPIPTNYGQITWNGSTLTVS